MRLATPASSLTTRTHALVVSNFLPHMKHEGRGCSFDAHTYMAGRLADV
jgi:hypothetical protein